MAEGDTTVMANGIEALFNGLCDLIATDTVRVALYSTNQFDADDNGGYVATSEVSAANYTAKGVSITTGMGITDDTGNNRIELDSTTNASWTSLGAHEIQQALIFDDSVTDATYSDVGLALVSIATDSNGGNYTINWSSDGIYAIGYSA